MKRKIIGVGCIVVLALSLSLVVYAAAGSFTMTYLPGTGDTVTNMPADDSGTGGQAYSVSSTVPQRAGYEFIDWTLDYDVDTTPEPTPSPTPTPLISYVVRHMRHPEGTDIVDPEWHYNIEPGYTAFEEAKDFAGAILLSNRTQTVPITKDKQELCFFYYFPEYPTG